MSADLQAQILAKLERAPWALAPLARDLGAFVPSVRAALDLLERDGRVCSKVLGAGSVGWALAAPPKPATPPPMAPTVAPVAAPAPAVVAPARALPRAGLATPRAPRTPRPPRAVAKPRPPARAALLNAIRAHPARCIVELAKILGWSPPVVGKHGQHLETEGKVHRRSALRLVGDRRQTVFEFWAADAPEPPPTPIAPRQAQAGAILALIGERPGITAGDLALALDLGPSTVSLALAPLERDGAIVRVGGPRPGMRGSPPLRCYLPADAPTPDAPPTDPRDAEIARLRAELASARAEIARLRGGA